MKVYMVYVKKYVPYEVDESVNIKAFLSKHKAKALIAELTSLMEEYDNSRDQLLRSHEYFEYFKDNCGEFHFSEMEVDESL